MRVTKKQKRMLDFIIQFMDENGYSPSYREIKTGLNYGSVATVAKHIDNLAALGLINKTDHEARSIEVVGRSVNPLKTRQVASESEQKWLIDEITRQFDVFESSQERSQAKLDELYVLVGALKILGLTGPFTVFAGRLKRLTEKQG